MNADFNALLSQMSPEELEQLLGLGTLDERGEALQQQMALAQALQQPTGGHPSITPLGGALGALNNGLRYIHGANKLEKLQKDQEALLAKKDEGRGLFVDAMRRRAAGLPATEAMPAPVAPFALGG